MGRYHRDWIALSVIAPRLAVAAAEITRAHAGGLHRLEAHLSRLAAPTAGVSIDVRVR